MSSVKYRLAAFERRIAARGPNAGACPECEGLGPHCMSIEIDGIALRPPPACPRCGAPPSGDHLARLIIDGPCDDPV